MQINEGMFVGSPGWVLKPATMMGMGAGMAGKFKFSAEIAGISSCKFSRHSPMPFRSSRCALDSATT